MASRDKITKAMNDRLPAHAGYDVDHPYHFQNYEENLYTPMGEQALQAYSRGSGGELVSKDGPPKMTSIASSSAMTFNLLGNGPAVIVPGSALPAGAYQVEFEKQLLTQNTGKFPANLDAFLSNESARIAIFCEMKMLEWLQKPNGLAQSYGSRERFFNPDDGSHKAFKDVIKKLNAQPFTHYDAYQMFKHLLGIYNHTAHTTRNSLNRFAYPSMAGQYSQIYLVNVVNEFPFDDAAYQADLAKEHQEAEAFIQLIGQSAVPQLFLDNCGAKLKLLYMSAKDFASELYMPHDKWAYLNNRYF